MKKTMERIQNQADNCECGNRHYDIPIDTIVAEHGALRQAAAYIEDRGYERIVLVMDENTKQAAGNKLTERLEEKKLQIGLCVLEPNNQGDVIADEASLLDVFIRVPQDADLLVAVGSGTLHDISRFVSYKMNKPFLSIPTAPSVDGFNSMGAPIVTKGFKQTYQTHAPIAVFADLDILVRAPKTMIAAGFGDMLAKFTSLADWVFSHCTADEPYCPIVAEITRASLERCVQNADRIAAGDAEGIRILMEALIESGLAMTVFGKSHPASGGEHHLSHYWEMEYLKTNKRQLLHGAKVGVSTALIADKYKTDMLSVLDRMTEADIQAHPANSYIRKQRELLISNIEQIPDGAAIQNMIGQIGGPTTPKQLAISEELVLRSLQEAHHIRDRHTMLRYLNESTRS